MFGGYGWYKQANPSDDYLNGFEYHRRLERARDALRQRQSCRRQHGPTTPTTTVNRIAPYFWVGAKYAINSQIDVTGAYYYQQQTDYNTSACTYSNTHDRDLSGRKQADRELASAATNAPARRTRSPP